MYIETLTKQPLSKIYTVKSHNIFPALLLDNYVRIGNRKYESYVVMAYGASARIRRRGGNERAGRRGARWHGSAAGGSSAERHAATLQGPPPILLRLTHCAVRPTTTTRPRPAPTSATLIRCAWITFFACHHCEAIFISIF